MKIAITGAHGMLGRALCSVFEGHDVFAFTRTQCDITNNARLQAQLKKVKPDILVNAAAYTNVDEAEKEEAKARAINGDGVANLVRAAQAHDCALVHFSTDYVFDGAKKEGYGEDDTPNPINAYGRTKLLGEEHILASKLPRWYIIRTAWLYGAGGKNFVDTMRSLADEKKELRVVNDQIGSPTYTNDLASATLALIESERRSGIYHRTNDGAASWYDFAKEIFLTFGKTAHLAPCTSEEFPRPAPRPRVSLLRSTKLPPLRPYQDALRAYARSSSDSA